MLWLAIAGLSVMAFDSPGSENDRRSWAFVIALWVYPVVVVVCAGLAWLFFGRGKRSIALGLNFFPALYITGWAAILLILAVIN